MMIKDCRHVIGLRHPYGTNVFKVCESEMLTVKDLFFEKLQWNSATTININDKLWWLC